MQANRSIRKQVVLDRKCRQRSQRFRKIDIEPTCPSDKISSAALQRFPVFHEGWLHCEIMLIYSSKQYLKTPTVSNLLSRR